MAVNKNRRPNQAVRILRYMKNFGSITSRQAINDLGCMRLASRISELKRDGYAICRKMIKVKNRFGESCTVAEYSLLQCKTGGEIMTDGEREEELAGVIYSQCGVSIRNDESYAIAKKLIELGYKKYGEEQ